MPCARAGQKSEIGVIEHLAIFREPSQELFRFPGVWRSGIAAGAMDQGFDENLARSESRQRLQCDLRCDLAPQKFWNDYQTGGKEAQP